MPFSTGSPPSPRRGTKPVQLRSDVGGRRRASGGAACLHATCPGALQRRAAAPATATRRGHRRHSVTRPAGAEVTPGTAWWGHRHRPGRRSRQDTAAPVRRRVRSVASWCRPGEVRHHGHDVVADVSVPWMAEDTMVSSQSGGQVGGRSAGGRPATGCDRATLDRLRTGRAQPSGCAVLCRGRCSVVGGVLSWMPARRRVDADLRIPRRPGATGQGRDRVSAIGASSVAHPYPASSQWVDVAHVPGRRHPTDCEVARPLCHVRRTGTGVRHRHHRGTGTAADLRTARGLSRRPARLGPVAGRTRPHHQNTRNEKCPGPSGPGHLPPTLNVGDDLLSHTLASAVPSAQEGLEVISERGRRVCCRRQAAI